ncbi:MAG TPA: serine hydrolase, partial [Verrucomicrobiaceae bacterium]
MPRLLVLFPAILFIVSSVRADEYFPPPDSEGGWRALHDGSDIRAKAGLDLARLEDAGKICERSTPNGGLLVLRHGYLVCEKYFGRASR